MLVHEGFYRAYTNSLQAQVLEVLEKLPDLPVYVTGTLVDKDEHRGSCLLVTFAWHSSSYSFLFFHDFFLVREYVSAQCQGIEKLHCWWRCATKLFQSAVVPKFASCSSKPMAAVAAVVFLCVASIFPLDVCMGQHIDERILAVQFLRTGPVSIFHGLSFASVLRPAGHSLGASIAAICAWDLKMYQGVHVPEIYTYGQPRTGNFNFAITYAVCDQHLSGGFDPNFESLSHL